MIYHTGRKYIRNMPRKEYYANKKGENDSVGHVVLHLSETEMLLSIF